MKYNIIAENIGVDSGLILLSDIDFYGKDHKEIDEKFNEIFNIKKGVYKLQWKIGNTMMGNLKGEGIINITSGKFVVSDPCYIVLEDKWDGLLEITNFFKKLPEGVMLLDQMGGDGIYDIEITILR